MYYDDFGNLRNSIKYATEEVYEKYGDDTAVYIFSYEYGVWYETMKEYADELLEELRDPYEVDLSDEYDI